MKPPAVFAVPHYPMLLDAGRLLGNGEEPEITPRPISAPVMISSDYQERFLLGTHALSDPERKFLADLPAVFVYDTEHPSTWTGSYLSFLRSVRACSYSEEGARMCGGTYLPLGYVPSLEASPDVVKDIDVLFFGSLSARREQIIDALPPALSVRTVTPDRPVYGAARDALVDRSKIVLNVHYYTDPPILESSRVVPALHRHACVLSEEYVGTPLCAQAPYDRLAERALDLVRSDALRAAIVRTSFLRLRGRPMPDFPELF